LIAISSHAIKGKPGKSAFFLIVEGSQICVSQLPLMKVALDYKIVEEFPDTVTTNEEDFIISMAVRKEKPTLLFKMMDMLKKRISTVISEEEVGKNIDSPTITVKHSDLTRITGQHEGYFARHCPVCEDGVLLGRRDRETLELMHDDFCCLCGQHVIYEDLEMAK
jgi:hypothetical protein